MKLVRNLGSVRPIRRAMPRPASLDTRRIERALRDLESLQIRLQRSANAEALCAAESVDTERHLGRAGGFAATARRVAIVRETFGVEAPNAAAALAAAHGGPRAALLLVRQLVGELRGWTAEETAEAKQSAGGHLSPQRHAAGREEALAEVLAQLDELTLSATP